MHLLLGHRLQQVESIQQPVVRQIEIALAQIRGFGPLDQLETGWLKNVRVEGRGLMLERGAGHLQPLLGLVITVVFHVLSQREDDGQQQSRVGCAHALSMDLVEHIEWILATVQHVQTADHGEGNVGGLVPSVDATDQGRV